MRTTILAAAALVLSGLAVASAEAAVLKVPSADYPDPAAAAAAAQDGDTILVAAGTYPVGMALQDLAGVTIKGKGEVILQSVGDLTILSALRCENLTVQGITFTGAKDDAVRFEDCTGLRFLKNTVRDARAALRTTTCDDMRVEKNTFRDLEGDALIDYGSRRPVIQKNVVEDAAGFGLRSEFYGDQEDHGARILKNRIARVTYYGVYTIGLRDAIEKNRIEDCLAAGVVMESSSSNLAGRVRSNTVTGSAYGLRLFGTSLLVERNSVTDCGDGILMYFYGGPSVLPGDGTESTVKSNRLTGIGDRSIFVVGAAHIVERNSITAAGDVGVLVDGDGCRVVKNKLGGGDGNAIQLGGPGCSIPPAECLVEGNSIKGFAGNGIAILDGGGNLIRKNKAKGNGDGEETFDLYDHLPEGGNEYEGNKFGTTHFGTNGK